MKKIERIATWKLTLTSLMVLGLVAWGSTALSEWILSANWAWTTHEIDIFGKMWSLDYILPWLIIGLATVLKVQLNGKFKLLFTNSYNAVFNNYKSNKVNINEVLEPIRVHMKDITKRHYTDKGQIPTENWIKECLMTYLEMYKENWEILYPLKETVYSNIAELYNYLKEEMIRMCV